MKFLSRTGGVHPLLSTLYLVGGRVTRGGWEGTEVPVPGSI